MLAWGAVPLCTKKKSKNRFTAVRGLFGYSYIVDVETCVYWQISTNLFRHTLQVTRAMRRHINNMGHALFQEGDVYGAAYHYSKAINIQPDALGYFNRGLAYGEKTY
jgi:hypothetical protein